MPRDGMQEPTGADCSITRMMISGAQDGGSRVRHQSRRPCPVEGGAGYRHRWSTFRAVYCHWRGAVRNLTEICRQFVTVLCPHLVSVESAIRRWEVSPMPALGTCMARLAGVSCRCRNRRSAYTGGWLVAPVWTVIFP